MSQYDYDTDNVHGFVRPSGYYQQDWPKHHNLPHGKGGSFSSAGWTKGNEGLPQQTFLGASIRSFNLNAGFFLEGVLNVSNNVLIIKPVFFLSSPNLPGNQCPV